MYLYVNEKSEQSRKLFEETAEVLDKYGFDNYYAGMKDKIDEFYFDFVE